MKAIRYCIAGVFLLLIFYARPQAAVAAGEEVICPAFFDGAGERLLITERYGPPDLTNHMYAIFADNQISQAYFLKKQPASAENTKRQTAANFENYPGYVFTLDKQGNPGETCLVVSETFLSSRQFIAYEAVQEGLTEAETVLIETVCQREIVNAWEIARLATGQKLALVRFEAIGDDQLASLVLLDCDYQPVFRHYHGKGRDNSVWRVDDGGKIRPKQFKILYIAREQNRTEIAYEFIGPEGIQVVVAREDGGEFQSLLEYSRYTSPY